MEENKLIAEIQKLIADGKDSRQIADKLKIPHDKAGFFIRYALRDLTPPTDE